MEEPNKFYFIPVSFRHSIILKLFLLFFVFALLAVLITIFFLAFIPLETRLFVIVIFVVVPALLIAVLFAQYISKPIKDLMEGLQKIAKNDYNFEITTTRKDELGHLILLFNDTLKKLKDVRKKNEEINGMKSTFVTVTAHQLRTPATGIKWAIENLKSDPKLSDDQKVLLSQSYEAINQITEIINDFLDLAKIEGEDLNYTFQKTNIVKLLEASIKYIELRAKEHNVSIEFNNKSSHDILLVADSTRLMNVFEALLDNAISYSDETDKVSVEVSSEKNSVLITVTDHGIGIPLGDQSKIFSRFYRAENAIAHRPNGSGIGLYICHKVIEQHEGKIWFTSKTGVGTTFYIQLPLAKGLIQPSAKVENAFETL